MNRNPRKSIHGMPTFYGVYEVYKEEVKEYSQRGWNAETTRQYDGIVRNHIIPHLKDHDRKHIGMFSRQDYDDAFDKLINRGKNQPGEAFEPWDNDGVPEKAAYLMRAVVHVGADHSLCEDIFDDNRKKHGGGGGTRKGCQQARMKKSLTVSQEIAVSKYLSEHIKTDGTAVGLLLMFALGLRNNEACGVNFDYIKEFKEYPGNYYMVFPQTTELDDNKVKILGKTKNSGRKIPLPSTLAAYLKKLQKERGKQAKARGYTGKVEDLPVAVKKNAPFERCAANDLSRAAREMFIRIGMREEDIIAINQDLLEEANAAKYEMEEDEFREIELHPTAYILRRNFATHLSILGLSYEEIRYVIGHKIDAPEIQRKAFSDEKLLMNLKGKLDERPILNPLIMDQNIQLEPNHSVSFGGAKKIVIKIPADQFSKVVISATAKEPGDEISMRILTENQGNPIKCEFVAHNTPIPADRNKSIDGRQIYREKYKKELSEKNL